MYSDLGKYDFKHAIHLETLIVLFTHFTTELSSRDSTGRMTGFILCHSFHEMKDIRISVPKTRWWYNISGGIADMKTPKLCRSGRQV